MIISGTTYVVNTGDIFSQTLRLENLGTSTSTNTIVTMNVPTGLSITAGTPTQGTFNVGTGIWTIGNLIPNVEILIILDFIVDDIAEAPFHFEAVASSDQIEDIVINNTKEQDIYQLCTAFSDCFQNQTTYSLGIPDDSSQGGILAWVEEEVPTPSCGDVVFLGLGSCQPVYYTQYDCNTSSWTDVLQLYQPITEDNVITVSSTITNEAGYSAYPCAYDTIEEALDVAVDGSIIRILDGVYQLTDYLNLSGKSNLTFELFPSTVIKGAEGAFIFDDFDVDYLGTLTIIGGQLYCDGGSAAIHFGSTDPTNKLIVKNCEIVNISGGAISSENTPVFLDNVKLYDVAAIGDCLMSSVPGTVYQAVNVFANTAEDSNVSVIIQSINVDPTFTINYV